MTNPDDYQARQRAQYARFKAWFEQEGGVEWPTQLPTMTRPEQVWRMQWLHKHAVGRILEAGCNFGLVTAWVRGQAGLDINPVNIELARLLNPGAQFTQGDIRKMPFEDQSFDTVLLPEVIEHLEWPDDVHQAIKEAKRIARDRVLVTIPYGQHDTRDALSMKHRWLADDPSIMELAGWLGNARVLVKHGFVVILSKRKQRTRERAKESESNGRSPAQAHPSIAPA